MRAVRAADAPTITAVAELGAATLERLAKFDPNGQRVLSLYLDLDPSRFPTPDTRRTQLGALLDQARRAGADWDFTALRTVLDADQRVRHGARALAAFSSPAGELHEIVALRTPVEPLAVVDTIPWLEPLAAHLVPGDWGVAIVSRRAARLLRGNPESLAEFATIRDPLHRRHSQGGWSQSRFQRGIEEQVAAHVHMVIDRLLRAHRRSPLRRLIVICSDELRPVIERRLPAELASILVTIVDADLEHAPAEQVAATVASVVERTDREAEREAIARLEQALGTGGPATAGLDEVLATLEQHRVDTLLVGEGIDLRADLCPTCGRLSSHGRPACPLDGDTLTEVDAVEHAVLEAIRQSARVQVIRFESEWLLGHGGIAALLRW